MRSKAGRATCTHLRTERSHPHAATAGRQLLQPPLSLCHSRVGATPCLCSTALLLPLSCLLLLRLRLLPRRPSRLRCRRLLRRHRLRAAQLLPSAPQLLQLLLQPLHLCAVLGNDDNVLLQVK